MDKDNKNKINFKYFTASLILAVLLAIAGIMQMNIPADRNKVPPAYSGNMLLVVDQIGSFTYNDPEIDENVIIKVLTDIGQYEQISVWQKFFEQRRIR